MSPRAIAARRGLPPAAAGVSAPADRRFRAPDVRPGRRRRLGQLVVAIGRRRSPSPVVPWRRCLAGLRASCSARACSGSASSSSAATPGSRPARSRRSSTASAARTSSASISSSTAGGSWTRRGWRRVALWRVLPSTVEVRVVERVAAWSIARLGQQLYLVDAAGCHHRRVRPAVPRLRSADRRRPDRAGGTPAARSSTPERIRLVERAPAGARRAAGPARRRLSQVDVSQSARRRRAARRRPGAAASGRRRGSSSGCSAIWSWRRRLRERLPEIDYVDLRFDERVYVRSRSTHEQGL